DIDKDQATNFRHVIETGYLQMILKGGIIGVCLFLLITIPAIFLGLFQSKNILSKAAAIWIIMALLNSYPTIITGFTFKYLLVWISIGICYSQTIRSIKEKHIQQYLISLRSK